MENFDKMMEMVGLMFDGAGLTLEIFFTTLVFTLPLGLLVALIRLSKFRPLSFLMEVYIWLMRGTPLMLQLLFIYYALPIVADIRLPDFSAAIIAFVLNYAAYFAEIFRGGIQSIERGQYEAAKTLGMTYVQTMRRIVLPQGHQTCSCSCQQRNDHACQRYIARLCFGDERSFAYGKNDRTA